MGMFEQLLVRRLQKQQHRIQFCDIVIQAQDVSVPVHSSVLSAFSPRLCEFLSGLPALPGGKSRVIELEGVEGCTMLRLVRWLYTGTAEGEGAGMGVGMGKDLLKAAEKLGITLFQERGAREEDEKRGGDGEVTLKNNGMAFKRVIARWSEEERGMKRRVCKDAETQTDGEGGKHTVDTDTQTDLVDVTSSQSALCMYNNRPDLVDLQSAIAPLDALGQLPWVTGGCFHTASSVNEPTLLTTLTDDDAIPMELPSTLDESMVRQLIGAVEVAPTPDNWEG
ncbi:uncharacterized protein LOC134440006 [Engraulis encrasicolus]|uniref:uncharacterized protein LOC134440006 n=1 Tax=Engraulis encrasicolus TaxID=184585 RepID=UPI002FD10847